MKELDDLLSLWEQHKEKGESISAEELCRDNPEWLAEVRRQIQALEAVDSRFGIEKSQFRSSIQGSLGSNAQLLNQEFQITNRYQIDRHHASGGLGDVFLGTDPVLNRKVAIKFPRPSRLTNEHLARFEREARITGQLDHPGIVAVHSLKLADDSQPCYVMRFVEGPTLQERVKAFHQQADDTHERNRYASVAFCELLQHFVALCNIVGYAHDRGVIHRDIKPSNVILGPYGETFLMDWGLARELNESISQSTAVSVEMDARDVTEERPESGFDKTDTVKRELETGPDLARQSDGNPGLDARFTQNGQFLGTPAFAAPEQLLGQVENTNHRADLYALGATLFFLIAGQPPVRDPGRSEHLQALRAGTVPWAAFPHGTPVALPAICRHAMSFAPADRYVNALALAADVQQYLADEPVSVLSESWSNRAFRWLRKNRTLTLTVAISLLLLSALSVLATGWVTRLNSRLTLSNKELNQTNSELVDSRSRELQARELAEENFNAARDAVQQYLIRIDDNEKLDQSDFSDLKRELLLSAKPFLERLRNQTTTLAAVDLGRIEAIYRLAVIEDKVGNFAQAKSEYEQCIALTQEARQLDPDNLELTHRLGNCFCNLAAIQRRQGELDKAEENCRAAVELTDAVLQKHPDEIKLLEVLNLSRIALANTLSSKGKQPAAAEILKQAIVSGTTHLALAPESEKAIENLAQTHEVLGFVLRNVGKRNESLEQRQLAMGLREQLVQKFPKRARYRTLLGMSHLNLGVMLAETGQTDLAREQYLKGLEIQRRLAVDFPANPLHLDHAAKSLNNLGNIASVDGPGPTPAEYFQQSIEIHQQLCERFSDDLTQIVSLGGAYCNLANYQMRSNPELAVETFGKAEELLKRVELQSPDIPVMRSNLRNVYGGRASALGMLYRPAEAKSDWLNAAQYDEGPNRSFFRAQADEANDKIARITIFEAALETGLDSTDPTEWAAFGEFCLARKQSRMALQSFRQAFIEQPELIERFGDNAAVAALERVAELAGEPEAESESEQEQRQELRELALSWLTIQLDALPSGPARRQKLRQWSLQPELKALKSPETHPDLNSDEVQDWREFWQRVENLN